MIRNALSWSTLVRVVNLLRNWASLDCFTLWGTCLVVFVFVFYNASSDAFFLCVIMVLLVRAMCVLDLCMTSFLVTFLWVFEHSFIVLIMWDKGQWGLTWFAMLCPEVRLWGWLTFWGTEPVLIAFRSEKLVWLCLNLCFTMLPVMLFLCVKMLMLVRAMRMLDLCMTSFLVTFLWVFNIAS